MAKKQKYLKSEELFAFSDEMSTMIKSGISSVEALTLMTEESEIESDKTLLKELQTTLLETSSLAKSVEKSEVFPEYYCKMLSLGESTGKLDNTLESLARHYDREVSIRKSIKSAIGYPILMVSMMLVIILVLVTEIMPIFEKVFKELGASMTGVSGGLLKVGKFIGTYAIILALIAAALIAIILYIRGTKGGKSFFKSIGNKSKSLRRINDNLSRSRFAGALAMALSSGMDQGSALDLASELVDDKRFGKKIAKCNTIFNESADLGKALSGSGIFIGLYGRMLSLSFRTGNVEAALEKISETSALTADEEISTLISVVEPTLVIVMSVVVGMILLSVMLPLLSIMAAVK